MPPQRGPGIYVLVEAEAILACQTVVLRGRANREIGL
jgi:hypothetical protein